MKELIRKISEGLDLTREEASSVMRNIMEGNATEAQIAGFLIGLKMKGECANELLGLVEVMREKCTRISIDDPTAVDMCGTGGDGSGTFNISTVASFVVSGAGVTVAKHGNRSISSSCGSADVLKALGVKIELIPEKVSDCINKIGIGFLFAPLFHPAMKHAAKPRTELGIKTAFNLLGPLTNPAGVRRQLVGAFSNSAAKIIASVFENLENDKVFVAHSSDGLDEISLEAPTKIIEVNGASTSKSYEVDSASFKLPIVPKSDIIGSTADANAEIALRILNGDRIPHRHYVVANAAFGLMASGKSETLEEAVILSIESIDSGNALKKLKTLTSFSNQ